MTPEKRGGRLIFEEKRNALNFLEPNEASLTPLTPVRKGCEGRQGDEGMWFQEDVGYNGLYLKIHFVIALGFQTPGEKVFGPQKHT